VALSGILLAASCTKQYNEKPIGQNSNGNGNSGGTGGTGGGGPVVNDTTHWNWTGTAPLSLTYDGTPYLADSVQVTLMPTGYYAITSRSADRNTLVTLVFPGNLAVGQVYATPTTGDIAFQSVSAFMVTGTTVGRIKMVKNNSTTLEGYFWGNMKNAAGFHDTAIAVRKGYFKVSK